jgi:hypothetical protein
VTAATLALLIAAICGVCWSFGGNPGGLGVMVVAGGSFLLGWWERPRWERPALVAPAVHRHDKSGGWVGDIWNFGDPNDAAATSNHIAKWKCSCGKTWTEGRDFDEYPHITARRDIPA